MLVLKRRIGLIDIMIDWMIERKQQRRVRRGETEREEADPLVGWNEQIPWGEEVIHSSFVTYGCGWPRRRKEGTCW